LISYKLQSGLKTLTEVKKGTKRELTIRWIKNGAVRGGGTLADLVVGVHHAQGPPPDARGGDI
jgi:hypothetical protein